MIIPDTLEKYKKTYIMWAEKAFIPIITILTLSGALGGWKVYTFVHHREPISIEYPKYPQVERNLPKNDVTFAQEKSSIDTGVQNTIRGDYVAAKKGKTYYKSTCTSSNRIAEKNRVWFASPEDAEKAGYVPAKNCKF